MILGRQILTSKPDLMWRFLDMTEDNYLPGTRISTAEYIQMLSKQTEAGNALVLAGFVEDWLQKLILHSTRPISNTITAKIYDGYGPLSQFSPKIEIAYIFELIDEATYNDLRAIKDIRNRFAHTIKFVTFASEEVANECQRLGGWVSGNDNQRLYLEKTKECVETMKQKIDLLLYAHALKDEPERSSSADRKKSQPIRSRGRR